MTTHIFKNILNIILLIILFINQSTAQSEMKILVKPASIGYFNFFEKYTAIGQVKSKVNKEYYATIAGTVDFISSNQNAKVAAGELLIAIEKDLAKATKATAKATYISAKSTFERDKSLFNKKIINQQAFDQSKVKLEQARLELEKAEKTFSDMVIKAPFAGYIGVIKANVGDEVKVGDYLFSLIMEGVKNIFVELPENLQGQVCMDSEIFVKDLNEEKIAGKISAIANYVSNQGTISAKTIFPETANITHGSFVEVDFIYNSHTALALPEKAVLKNNTGHRRPSNETNTQRFH